MMCIIYVDEVVVYVRPAVQTVTITLLIHYCILSTTYSTNNYNVNNKQRKLQNNQKFSEIYKNSYKYIYITCYIPIVIVLNVVYDTHSFTKRGNKYENG